LNPNTSDFEVLSPHFTTGMDYPFIKEAILISYPNIMNRIENKIRNNNLNENNIIPQNNIMRNLHQWDGKFWHVPKCFQFPPNYKNEKGDHSPIMPFRRMSPTCLPKVISN
jgi:hypothetical protein